MPQCPIRGTGCNIARDVFRISFNILVGNTDDHARNHAAFVVGDLLELTPGYDVAPQPRPSETARHPAFDDGGSGRDSRIAALVAAAPNYHLSEAEGREIADHQVETIRRDWTEVCDIAKLTGPQRDGLMGGPILNPYAFYELA